MVILDYDAYLTARGRRRASRRAGGLAFIRRIDSRAW